MTMVHYADGLSKNPHLETYAHLEEIEYRFAATAEVLERELERLSAAIVVADADALGERSLLFYRRLRRFSEAPIFVLSSDSDDIAVVSAFEEGVDEYIEKPVSEREIVLRVRAFARRIWPGRQFVDHRASVFYCEGDPAVRLVMDPRRYRVEAPEGVPIHLTGAEWKVLTFLADTGGAVCSRERIVEHCFGYDQDSYDRIVDTHIQNIRLKLRDPCWIETVRGFGYRFNGYRSVEHEIPTQSPHFAHRTSTTSR